MSRLAFARLVAAHPLGGVGVASCVVVGLIAPAGAAGMTATATASRAAGPRGTLIVHVTGLPKGERPDVSVSGPRHFHRAITKLGATRIAGLRAGSYVVHVHAVTLRAAHGTAKRGARATAATPDSTAAVSPGVKTSVTADYGSIANPHVQTLKQQVTGVVGSPDDPTGVVIAGSSSVKVGQLISQPPSATLPHGLLSAVTNVDRSGGQTTVSLRPASVFEALPNADFDIPVDVSAAGARAGIDCAAELTNGALPSIKLSNARLHGTWNTVKVLGHQVRVGLKLTVSLRATLTVNYEASSAISCTVSTHAVYVQGMAGPVPVYATVDPKVTVEIKRGARFGVTGAVDITAGAETVGVPPAMVWAPILTTGNPSVTATAEAINEGSIAAGIGTDMGIGQPDTINARIERNDLLTFTTHPGACDLKLNVASFNAGGKVGPFDVKTPDTPSLIPITLFQGCAGVGEAPVPTPSPTPAPAPSGTLVYQGNTTGNELAGDLDFTEFADATAKPLAVENSLPADLAPYRCVVLDLNDDFSDDDVAHVGAYLRAGGTVLALGEHEASAFSPANAALNDLATRVGASGLSLGDDSWDDGPNATDGIGDDPLLADVSWIGDNWVSSVGIDAPAVPLVETAEDPDVPFIGAETVGQGRFVMSGDSNAFSDNNDGLFADNDNGQFVRNMCG